MRQTLLKLSYEKTTRFYLWIKATVKSFPGGALVKNLPASAGDTGSSPGPGRFHMPWSNSRAQEPQLLKPACLEPVFRNKRSHHSKPAHCNEE